MTRSDFRWDNRRGVYICPNNKVLHTTGTVHDGSMLCYRASKFDCPELDSFSVKLQQALHMIWLPALMIHFTGALQLLVGRGQLRTHRPSGFGWRCPAIFRKWSHTAV